MQFSRRLWIGMAIGLLVVVALVGYGVWLTLTAEHRTLSGSLDDVPGSVDLPSARPPAKPNGGGRPAGANGNGNSDRPAAPAPPGSELDAILARLDRGTLVFNTPPRMRVSSTREIQAVLQAHADVERLRGLITAAGRIEGFDIRVANVMQAELRGVAFHISPDGPQEQPTSRSEPTQWTWQVKAKESGAQILTLSLFAKVRVDEQERSRLLKTFTREIEVEVAGSWAEEIAEALQPWQEIAAALTAIGGALWGAYVWWRKHMRRRRPAGP